MKKLIPIILLLTMLFPFSAVQADEGAQVLDPTALFVPDITGVEFESDATVADAAVAALPNRMPFNADLVDAEISPNTGQGVYVAVLDTGLVSQWPVLFSQANIAADLGKGFTHDLYWDGTVGEIMMGPLREDRGFITGLASGHGTHVTSIITGYNRNNLYWVQGVAPQVTIIPVLVLDAWEVATPSGAVRLSGGSDEMVSAGIYYIADLAETLDGPVVINMSLGGAERSTMIEEAVDYAIGKGVIVVASAGNDGEAGMGYPGGLSQIISAAAGGWSDMFYYYPAGWYTNVPEKLNSKDNMGNNWQIYLEDFSSRPNKYLDQKHQDLDVTTPGAWVVGPYRAAFSNALGYYYVSGTSQAAPHVSAIAALVLQTHPDLQQTEMEAILESAAHGLPLPADDAIVAYPGAPYLCLWDGGDAGAGFLQVPKAITVANIMDK